jgi:hypothetical protein
MKIDIKTFVDIEERLHSFWLDHPETERELILNALLLHCQSIIRLERETVSRDWLVQQIAEIMDVYEDEL